MKTVDDKASVSLLLKYLISRKISPDSTFCLAVTVNIHRSGKYNAN